MNTQNPNLTNDDQEILDLSQYWRMIKDFKWGIAIITAVIFSIGFVAIKRLSPVYQATTSVLIEKEQANVTGIKELYGVDTSNKEYIQTQYEILKSRSLAEKVVTALDLVNKPEFNASQLRVENWKANLPYHKLEPLWPFEKSLKETLMGPDRQYSEEQLFNIATSKVMSGLSINPIRNTQIVKINFQLGNPELAAQISNTFADQFIERHLSAKLELTEKATNWLGKSLDGLRDRMRESAQQLQSYREREKLLDIKGVQTLNARELNELTERYTDVQRERLRAQNIHDQIQSLGPAPNYQYLLEIPAIANDHLVSAIKKEFSAVESKVAELGKRYGHKHPKMIAANTELKSLEKALQHQAQLVARGLQTEYRISRDNESAVRSQIERSKSGLQEVNRKEFELRELEREVETNRQLYEMFMTRAKETNEIIGLQSAHARIIDEALPPKRPIKPNKKMLYAGATFFGLFLGIAIAFIRGAMDNTTKSTKDIENNLHLSVLGEIPRVKQNNKDTAFEGFISQGNSLFAESIRTLRTSLVLANPDQPYSTIVITSSVPDEGKSTIALNLAEAFGQNERVLLIDADMRRPMLARTLNLPPHTPGLTNIVAGTSKLSPCLHSLKGTQVDVLTAGLLPNNPLELLSSQRFSLMLYKLKQRYDRIILDTSPTHLVSDAMILAAQADAVIYVAKADSTPLPLLRNGVKRLREINAPLIGAVLNQVKSTQKYSNQELNYSVYQYTKLAPASSDNLPPSLPKKANRKS